MRVSVVVPTIKGREVSFGHTVDAYRETKSAEIEIIAPKGFSTIGAAWREGARKATGQFIHLAADDVLPHGGWLGAAIRSTCRMEYPSPLIVDIFGDLHSCGTMGGGMLLGYCKTGTLCVSSPFPFFRAEYAERLVGDFPDIHYYADDLVAHRARQIGLRPTVVREYALTHVEGTVGRERLVSRAMADRQTFLDEVARCG